MNASKKKQGKTAALFIVTEFLKRFAKKEIQNQNLKIADLNLRAGN